MYGDNENNNLEYNNRNSELNQEQEGRSLAGNQEQAPPVNQMPEQKQEERYYDNRNQTGTYDQQYYHNTDPYYQSQRSSAYQNPNGQMYQNIPEEPPKKAPRKANPVLVKAAGVAAAALLFGVVSGGTIVGINWISNGIKQQNTPEPVTITAASNDGNSNTAAASNAVSMDVSAIVEKAMPSVVAITNTMLYQSNSFFGPSQTYEVPSSGSGIIIGQNDSELLVVTNNHVVEGSEKLSVSFIDNSSVDASIKGTDSESDLAVVAVPLSSISAETLSKISIATLGDSDSLKVGQGVVAIGNALGYGQSVTVGYISALDREVQTDAQTTRNLLQTDAAINPGNSGGALLNMKGELIGINAAKYSSTEIEGMGYAIPISKATDIINELMNKKTRTLVSEDKQGYLGIQGQNIDQEMADAFGMPKGIYIYKIVEGGAAAQSDLREKDIITKFDGQTVRTLEDLKNMLTYYEAGSSVDLTVQSLQDGAYSERTVTVTLGNRLSSEVQQNIETQPEQGRVPR